MPANVPIIATAGVPLVHVPPADGLLRVTVFPVHTFDGPVILGGGGTTVIVAVVVHPIAVVKAMAVAPGATPVITRVAELIRAIDVLATLHIPLEMDELNVAVTEVQMVEGLAMAADGLTFTVTLDTVLSPHASVAVTV